MRWLRRLSPSGRLLDVGCGQGYWLSEASKYYDVSGCDISEYALAEARRSVPKAESLELVNANEDLPFPSATFDIVTVFDVVEHLREPQRLLAEAQRVLKRSGILILTTPNPKCISVQLKPLEWIGVRDKTHIMVRDARFWSELLRERHFEIIDTRYDGLWDVPYFNHGPRWTKLMKYIEHLFVQLPSVVAYNAGVRFSEHFGENTVILCKKTL